MTDSATRRAALSKLKLILLASLLLASGAAGAGARIWLPPSVEPGPAAGMPSAPPPHVTPARGGRQEAPQTELVTATPTGFEPAEIMRPAGRLILSVENRSGLEEIMLVLRDGGGRELLRERVPRERLDWSGTLDLGAGEYLLSEESHPQWACRLTLTEP